MIIHNVLNHARAGGRKLGFEDEFSLRVASASGHSRYL